MSKKSSKHNSTQELIGVKTFTDYGIRTSRYELAFFLVTPTNIAVLSHENIEIKIHHLMIVLSSIPDIEITCTDSSECFDENKAYLQKRIQDEPNEKVRELLNKDVDFLDKAQIEMATARQFLFIARYKKLKPDQLFAAVNKTEKTISDAGFEVKRMTKADIKRFLAIYFDASMSGEQMPDIDGEQYLVSDDGISR